MNYVDLHLVLITQYRVPLFYVMNITDAFQFLLNRSTSNFTFEVIDANIYVCLILALNMQQKTLMHYASFILKLIIVTPC